MSRRAVRRLGKIADAEYSVFSRNGASAPSVHAVNREFPLAASVPLDSRIGVRREGST